jgi:MFS transporter, Spinster family, sphingosine-1-phosphate transporter
MTLAFLNYMDRNLILPLLGSIGRDLDLDEDRLGAFATGFHVVYGASAPLVGRLADFWPRKRILIVAVVVWSIVTALSGLATGFLSLLVFRALTGLGEGAYFPTALSLIGDLFPKSQRGRAIALHGACTTLGGSAGYAIGGSMGERFGWRIPFLLAIVPGLILATVIGILLREPKRGMDADVRAPPATETPRASAAEMKPRPYLGIVTSYPVLVTATAALFASFAMNGLNSFLPMYLERERGVSVADAGLLTGAFFSATLIGQLSGGFASDWGVKRWAGARPLLVALPYLAAAPAVAMIVHSPSVMPALVCYGLAQLGRGFAEPNIYGTILDAVSPRERGSAQGFLLLFTFAGSSAGGWPAGLLIKHHGYAAAIHAFAGAAVIAGVLAVALFVRLRRGPGAAQAAAG